MVWTRASNLFAASGGVAEFGRNQLAHGLLNVVLSVG